eukprot:CAMPEP_0170407598 /NCGR_PEP_ID=MMETSP0117_2-20130122/28332_1 /TAXON_ID=400756 /ORGANISM="Durinskia baltica, Strain CSIRO CS-38" /LENGTH=68 /DNA_ID=CAMNT_0010664855 /DNA_START=323 /DNA_END=525 /DNA_ORIENTATION=+
MSTRKIWAQAAISIAPPQKYPRDNLSAVELNARPGVPFDPRPEWSAANLEVRVARDEPGNSLADGMVV